MKLPNKIDTIRVLKGKKFGGLIIDWTIIQEDGIDKIKGFRRFPAIYEEDYKATITSVIVKFHGKRIVETKNSFFVLWRKQKWPE